MNTDRDQAFGQIMKALLLALGWISTTAFGSDRPTTVAALFLTPENLEIVNAPDRVEACILYPKDPWFGKEMKRRTYKEGRSKPLPPIAASVLSSNLTNEKTYGWNYAKACMPTWNARVKFFRGDHYVFADFCFGCDILILGRDGQMFGGEDFDGASETIFEVIRTVFPDDRIIRNVLKFKESRRKADAQIKLRTELEKKEANP